MDGADRYRILRIATTAERGWLVAVAVALGSAPGAGQRLRVSPFLAQMPGCCTDRNSVEPSGVNVGFSA